MTVKVAINGFGRIGRNVLRALIENPRDDVEVIAVNTIPSLSESAYLLEFDSVHGRLSTNITTEGDMMYVGNSKIRFLSERDPEALDWGALAVDVVMECTGIFTDAEKATVHLRGGAKKVLVSAPSNGADLTVVYGVNHATILPEHKIISNASCTTNNNRTIYYGHFTAT